MEIKSISGEVLKVVDGDTLIEADLRGADLRWADLRWADLRGADLRGADLREADLRGADLRWADLREADLGGADLGWATGNAKEVCSIHADGLTAVWHEDRLFIGCKVFTFLQWLSFDLDRIKELGGNPDLWEKWAPIFAAIYQGG